MESNNNKIKVNFEDVKSKMNKNTSERSKKASDLKVII